METAKATTGDTKMTRNFYAVDYAPEAARGEGVPDIQAFTSIAARNSFVEDGNRRSAISRVAADRLCKRFYCDSIDRALALGMV